jgi:UDP-GlcNAc:undecaprenyl-phosphate GlcNAc-1-phosphate transferase
MSQSLFIVLSGVLSFLSMPLIILFCKKFSLYDYQNARKIHSGNIPRLGGVGIFLSFMISASIFITTDKITKRFESISSVDIKEKKYITKK